MDNQTILILDFGGQYKELIARRVRECGVYSLIKPYDISIEEIKKIQPIGIRGRKKGRGAVAKLVFRSFHFARIMLIYRYLQIKHKVPL